MFEFINDIGNYNQRRLFRSDINGFTVSTADTSDEGLETAIIDANGGHPVERYDTKEQAAAGHKKWVAFVKKAKKGTEVTMLGGLGGLVGSSKIALCPKEK